MYDRRCWKCACDLQVIRTPTTETHWCPWCEKGNGQRLLVPPTQEWAIALLDAKHAKASAAAKKREAVKRAAREA